MKDQRFHFIEETVMVPRVGLSAFAPALPLKNVAFALATFLKTVIRPSCVVACLYGALLLFLSLTRGSNALDYVHLGTIWSAHNPAGTWGYDGQFYYQLARDPLHAYLYMDNAPYRYQRIMYPFVVSLLSMRSLRLIPSLLLLVNGLAVVTSVEVLARLLVRRGLSPWFSLALGLYFGQIAAFSFDTAEPFTFCLVCLGTLLLDDRRVVWAALLMGLAALSRETSVVFAAGYGALLLLRRQRREAGIMLLLGICPLLLWLLALRLIFGETGLTFTPPFEHIPFGGMLPFINAPHKIWLLLLLMFVPTFIGCIVALWELVCWRWGQWLRLTFLGIWLANLGMIVFLSRFSYIELISCGRIATGVVVAGLLYATMTRNRRVLWGMQYYALTCVLYFVSILLVAGSFIS